MKFNQWTLALASLGVVSMGSVAQAEEHSVMSTVASTTLSGYVDTSAIWKVGTGRTLVGRQFDGTDKVDGFNLNVVKLVLEKALGDENSWSAGYKADLVFGPDANYYTTLNNTGVAKTPDDFNIKQAYVALRAPVGNGLDFKMGVWDTLIGYEFFESGSNPNYSRSFGYQIEPTHHTGLLASYKITDMFSISAGIANAYAGGINDKNVVESKKAYLAAITITLPEGAGSMKNSVISIGYVGGRNGSGGTATAVTQDSRSFYAGFTLNTPVEGLQVGAAWDYRADAAGITPLTGNVNDAYAIAAYVSYGMDKWKANVRVDYTQATDASFYDVTPGRSKRNELGAITATLDYNLWENVLTRLEARYDRALNGDRPYGFADESAMTVALNAIYKF
jgi:hypothetical protein